MPCSRGVVKEGAREYAVEGCKPARPGDCPAARAPGPIFRPYGFVECVRNGRYERADFLRTHPAAAAIAPWH